MAFSPPIYIEQANVYKMPVEYEWIDGRPALHYGDEKTKLRNRVADISYRAVMIFATGCAEWVAWRLSQCSQDEEPFLSIEAVRAASVDIHYFNTEYRPNRGDWAGPVRGALFASSYLLRETVCDVSILESATEYDAVCLSNLVEHVYQKPSSFRKWRKTILDRLAQWFPYSENDELGSLVPVEVLDPNFEFKPEISRKLVGDFLHNLDHTKNPYLRSPEEMLKAGFEGIPYSL